MATSGQQFCDICISQHITTPANLWCPECEETFCEKCKIRHAIAKATKKHETIGIENAQKLPNFVQDIKINCSEHDERFVFFCGDHDVPCCAECLYNTHKNCRELTPVKTIVQNIKDSSAFLDLEVFLADLLANIKNVIDDRTANLQDLSKQKTQCEEEIKTFRETINSYIDSLERDLINKLNQAFEKTDLSIKQVLNDLEARKTKVYEMQENVNSVKTIASNFQTFIAIRELAQWANKEESDLQNLYENESFNWTELSVVPMNLQSVENSFTNMGQIEIKGSSSRTQLKVRKTREAQLISAGCISAEIDMISLKEKVKVDLPKKDKDHEILDCGILKNGDLLFSDRKNKCLSMHYANGKLRRTYDLPFIPIRFAIIDEKNIAMTTDCKVIMLELNEGKVTKTFEQYTKVGSVALYCDNKLIVEHVGKGYTIIDLTGDIENVISIQLSEKWYTSFVIIREHLYHVDCLNNKVHCRDFHGNNLWEFHNEGMETPFGVTSDGSNILFFCGLKSNNVFAVSSDGKSFKEIIKPHDELNLAATIHYNVSRRELLIVTLTGHVFLYEVAYNK
ncbi:Hypothetical predicted protein [Mytilus galloprovincialis]|uniref:B box-type domain-containing protein n=1 Tax=Mytilus galloprovincialis TaxID=29158 RepID=A0A8B6DI15_MYTGA|nr:Hypothetical predicted protein [Mytilus galloprovincialis]